MYFSLQILKSVKQKEVHRGQLLKNAADASGMTVEAIVQKMGYSSRNTYYNHTQKQQLSFKILERYGKVLKVDFAQEIDELKPFTASEPETTYLGTPSTIEDAIRQRDYYVKLYWEKLEEFRKLEEELKTFKQEKKGK